MTAPWYSLSPMAMAWAEGKRPSFCTSQMSQALDTVIVAALFPWPSPLAQSHIRTRPTCQRPQSTGCTIQRFHPDLRSADARRRRLGCSQLPAVPLLARAALAPPHGVRDVSTGDRTRPRHNAPANYRLDERAATPAHVRDFPCLLAVHLAASDDSDTDGSFSG